MGSLASLPRRVTSRSRGTMHARAFSLLLCCNIDRFSSWSAALDRSHILTSCLLSPLCPFALVSIGVLSGPPRVLPPCRRLRRMALRKFIRHTPALFRLSSKNALVELTVDSIPTIDEIQVGVTSKMKNELRTTGSSWSFRTIFGRLPASYWYPPCRE